MNKKDKKCAFHRLLPQMERIGDPCEHSSGGRNKSSEDHFVPQLLCSSLSKLLPKLLGKEWVLSRVPPRFLEIMVRPDDKKHGEKIRGSHALKMEQQAQISKTVM